jgi:hypothetical protein
MDPLTGAILEQTQEDRERINRYASYWRYYFARAYFSTDDKEVSAIEEYLKARKMFKEMRDIFSCVGRVVDTDTRFVMKRQLRIQAEDRFAEAINQMWERSNLQVTKYKLVRFGSLLGDSYLYLLPGEIGPTIYVGNTEDFAPFYDPHDSSKLLAARQSYKFRGSDNQEHEWCRIFYPDRIETYIDQKLQTTDDFGNIISGPHNFGQVPVFHVKNLDSGERFGVHSWALAQPKLDILNEIASYARRIFYRYADPKWLAKNLHVQTKNAEGKPILQQGSTPAGDNIIYLFGENADMTPLEFRGNVLPQLLEYMKEIYADIKDDLPELSLSKLRERQSGDISGYAVSLHLGDAIAKIDELRGNYGNALEWCNQVALRSMFGGPQTPLEEYPNKVVFEPILAEDREARGRIWKLERDLGVLSRREMLREDGMSEGDIDERLKEVEEDRKATTQQQQQAPTPTTVDPQQRKNNNGGNEA